MDFHVLIVTAVMIVLDVVVGFAGAVRNKDVQSAKLRDGLWHKAAFVGLIALAYVIQYATLYADLGFEIPAVAAVCVYVIVIEIAEEHGVARAANCGLAYKWTCRCSYVGATYRNGQT